MSERRQIANEVWQAFKHWDGEKKYALRRVVSWLKNTPGEPGASDLPHADGLSEDRNIVQAEEDSNVAHSVERHAP